jgi:hypothetical protein
MARTANELSSRGKPGGPAFALLGPAVEEDEEQDEYYEYNDDRPTPDPVDRPTVQRSERPMRTPALPRMGPSRQRTR